MTIKERLNHFKKEREAAGFIIDNDILNLTYWVMKNYNPSLDEEDICLIYDNLEINSEIISKDNLDEYDQEQLKKIFPNHRLEWVKQQLEKGYFFLLDFYKVNSKGFCEHVECCLKFKEGYNAL